MAALSSEETMALVEAARGGDRGAFDRLVGVLHRPLIGFIRSRITCAVEDAEDVAQEVWCDVWRQIDTPATEGGYDPAKGTFYTYVAQRFARFAVLRWVEARGKRLEIPASSGSDENLAGADPPDARESGRPDVVAQMEERLRLRNLAFLELFRLTFLCGGYPHQQLAFGFSKHIYGKTSPRGIEGDPARVDREHGETELESLAHRYWEAYRSVAQLDGESLRRLWQCLEPLRARLPLGVGDLLELDHASRERLDRLLEETVARTCLRDYYVGRQRGFTAAIPDWCYKVERRVREILGIPKETPPEEIEAVLAEGCPRDEMRPPMCRRCKLRHAPPCASQVGASGSRGGVDSVPDGTAG